MICEGFGVMKDMYDRGGRGGCTSENMKTSDVDGDILIQCLKKTDIFCPTSDDKLNHDPKLSDTTTNFDLSTPPPPTLFPEEPFPILSSNYEMI